ncbi:MAG: pyridoxal phosphate-dependent aminotransferase [Clostridia bacterium]|nr:pyridoxal phosphate-dependent aminotransferase [Clostridia bacterium]
MTDFNFIHNRKGTNSLKYDFAAERGKSKDLIPLWVADMDFPAPEEVITALKEKAEHGIFGYSEPDEKYFSALYNWLLSRHGWETQPENFVVTCGVVFSICALIRAITKVGDAVIICQPVYYPFAGSVTDNGRRLIVSELKEENGYYTVDFDDFEKKIIENDVKAFILCNPHNPVGRVWTREELEKLGDICLKHGVFVISDEIHSDFVYGENKHIVFPKIKSEFEDICAVCTAPTKTFNLAGLHIANTYVKSDIVRGQLKNELEKQGYSQPNIMGLVACRAAYEYGAKWLEELKAYLTQNLQLVREYASNKLGGIKLVEPQGTYLVWLDCRALGVADEELSALFEKEAKLWVDDGFIFGKGGSGFERINIACPRSVLKQALENLSAAVRRLSK